MAAGFIESQEAAVVEVVDQFLPRVMPAQEFRGVFVEALAVFAKKVGVEKNGRFHGDEESGRKHGVYKVKGITKHDPALAVAVLADELVVGVGHHVGDATRAGTFFGEEGLTLDGVLKAVRGGVAEKFCMILVGDYADGEFSLKGDALGPSMIENGDNDLIGFYFVVIKVFEVSKVCHVLSLSPFCGKIESSREKSGSAGAIDEVVGMVLEACELERMGREFQVPFRGCALLQSSAGIDGGGSQFPGPDSQEFVELRAGDVVGVAGIFGSLLSESKMCPRATAVEEGSTRFIGGEFPHAVFEFQLLKNWNH